MKIWNMILVLLLLSIPVTAMSPAASYGQDECELIAKDYQREYGGYLVFIQPLQANGAYMFGDYAGHWMNRAYSHALGVYYIDYTSGTYFNDTQDIAAWYEYSTGNKAEVYDFAVRRPPFGLIWRYT